MPDNGFVPLVPRLLERLCASGPPTADRVASTEAGSTPLDAVPGDAQEQTGEAAAPSVIELDDTGVDNPLVGDRARVHANADAVRVRALAIELAAAACARALRYAVDRNPRLLARFVDDALRAAGNPKDAVVRVAPSTSFAGDHPGTHAFVADPSLSAGDVFVNCDAGTLGATIEERAVRLVRAASQ